MSNNDVMKKLRVALSLRDDDIIEILKLANFRTTKTELSAIFRAEDHPNFQPCKDQLLRNFLNGLVIYKRGPRPDNREKNTGEKPAEAIIKNLTPKEDKA